MSASVGDVQRTSRDDRVLRSTRALSAFIAPFLLVAFVLLYLFPGSVPRLWAWPIKSHLTSMVLASAYLGGCWFFVRVLGERRWARVRAGLVSVALFASLLGVATIVHWDLFVHSRVAFWLWAGLYFTAPFLVVAAFVTNQRVAGPVAGEDGPRIGRTARVVIAGVGGLAGLTGLFLFFAPKAAIAIWPWTLTPLTSRTIGAVFCLGVAGLAVVWDDRWVALTLMRETELVMLGLFLVAAIRARSELLADRPLTWVLGIGFVALLVASVASLVGRPSPSADMP